jgi:hypothetical protein
LFGVSNLVYIPPTAAPYASPILNFASLTTQI